MFVHPQNPDLNQINGYLNIWKTPAMIAFAFIFILACFQSGAVASIVFVGFFAGSAAWIAYDYGALGLTEIDINTRSKLALQQCIDEAMRRNKFSDRTKLTKLSCNRRGIADLSALKDYTGLETLNVASNEFSDLKTLPRLPNLKQLSVSGNKKLTSLNGIEKAANLEILRADSSRVADITALATLNRLTEVYLSRNPVSDLSALSAKPDLEILLLYHTQVADLYLLHGSKRLVTLGVGVNTRVTCNQVREMRKRFGPQLTVPGPENCT